MALCISFLTTRTTRPAATVSTWRQLVTHSPSSTTQPSALAFTSTHPTSYSVVYRHSTFTSPSSTASTATSPRLAHTTYCSSAAASSAAKGRGNSPRAGLRSRMERGVSTHAPRDEPCASRTGAGSCCGQGASSAPWSR